MFFVTNTNKIEHLICSFIKFYNKLFNVITFTALWYFLPLLWPFRLTREPWGQKKIISNWIERKYFPTLDPAPKLLHCPMKKILRATIKEHLSPKRILWQRLNFETKENRRPTAFFSGPQALSRWSVSFFAFARSWKGEGRTEMNQQANFQLSPGGRSNPQNDKDNERWIVDQIRQCVRDFRHFRRE